MKTPEEIYKLWSNEDCENGRHETRYNSLAMVEFAKFYHSVMKVEERKEKDKKYIIELEAGLYLAPWGGDPGRTHKIDSSLVCHNIDEANNKLKAARTYRPFPNASIIEIETYKFK